MNEKLRISASSLKLLSDCSLAFYYSRVLKLPEREWPRTVVGSLVHSIFECLRHPRHRHHYDTITISKDKVDYTLSPALNRLVRMWASKHGISDELLADLNGMLYVGLLLTDFYWTKADLDPATGKPLIYGPEHAFQIVWEDGTEIKGFIDDMAVIDGIMVIRDYKSARNKQTQAEVPHTVQAIMYQLYVWRTFGLLARVEFVYLRHPPTARVKDRHLQIVQPSSVTLLEGFTSYVRAMYLRINAMTWEDAISDVQDDYGFCRNICTHYAPHPYYLVCKSDDPTANNPLSSHLSLDKARQIADSDGHIVIERQFNGCAVKWRE